MIVGILGGGQLGRMLALAGYPLGLRFRFLDANPEAPAGQVAELIAGRFEDENALRRFAHGLDVATFEFENVPARAVRILSEQVPTYPGAKALETAQDRLHEKRLFRQLGIPVPEFAEANQESDIKRASDKIGLPAVLKMRRLGYDGKGQAILKDKSDIAIAWNAVGGGPAIVEQRIPFERELSIIAVRAPNGNTAFYPLIENHHSKGLLRYSLPPARGLPERIQMLAEGYVASVLDALDYVGVLAMEFFQLEDTLIANEIAPRVHNSGHWTIEGSQTSQFENHLRAILGWSLGSTRSLGSSAMANLIGEIPDLSGLLAIEMAHIHLYGKKPRPGRKLGHVTVCAESQEKVRPMLDDLLKQIPEEDT